MRTVGNRSAGFTIVETLIVLAVSGMLAISAISLVNGRQNKTQFQVAATSMKQQIEQLINETASGYYPSSNNFTCSSSSGSVTISSGAGGQGTNSTCIFLGKAVAFGVGPTGADRESFIVYPLVGKRFDGTSTREVSTFAQAKPLALAPSTGGVGNLSGIDYSTTYKTKNGLSLHYADYIESGTLASLGKSNYVVFALADQLGQYQAQADGTLNSATQKLDLFEMDKLAGWAAFPAVPTSSRTVVDLINLRGIDTKVIEKLNLCFNSGTTNQSALITISGRGQLSVTLKIYGKADCIS